jgi:hypothetical protein
MLRHQFICIDTLQCFVLYDGLKTKFLKWLDPPDSYLSPENYGETTQREWV